jgi:signal transduction histidine kinase
MGLVLGLIAVFIFFYLPYSLEQYALDAASSRAHQIAATLSHQTNTSAVVPVQTPLDVALSAMEHAGDIRYLVIENGQGRVLDAMHYALAEKANFRQSDAAWQPTGEDAIYRARFPFSTRPGEKGLLYVGVAMGPLYVQWQNGKVVAAIISILLLLMALGLVTMNWWTMQMEGNLYDAALHEQALVQEKGQLADQVEELRRGMENVRELEQRYRTLFENAVEAAYKDLEVQKKSLEHEVAERKRAEGALRRLAARLTALNEVERAILMAQSPQEIAPLALSKLKTLVPFQRAILLLFDPRKGEAELLAIASEQETTLKPGTRVPLNLFEHNAAQQRTIQHVPDLSSYPRPTPMHEKMMQEGFHSYIVVPLVVEDEVVGAIHLAADQARVFTQEHISIVQEVIDLLALSIRQTRLSEERELYETELVVAKERAEEMARLKSVFLNNMTHEIRTPLSGIIGFAQILYEEVTPPHQEFARLVEESARRLLETINSVLDLARLEASRAKLQGAPCYLFPEIEQTVRLLNPLAQKKNLDLRVEEHCPDVWAALDKASLDRVLNNLVGNAIKFTNQGGVTVEVDGDEAWVIIRVRDTGIGISEEFMPDLFEEFRQESSGADRNHEGSGLGLAITRKLVGRMDGTLAVESKKDVGTTFTVRFPRSLMVNVATSEAALPPPASLPRLLLVEDKQDAALLLEYLLHESYRVSAAADLDQALHLAKIQPFDLLLVDVYQGENDRSAEMLQHLRAVPGYDRVPILATATQFQPPRWEAFLEMGFDGYVAKPFVESILLETLEGIRATVA